MPSTLCALSCHLHTLGLFLKNILIITIEDKYGLCFGIRPIQGMNNLYHFIVRVHVRVRVRTCMRVGACVCACGGRVKVRSTCVDMEVLFPT